MVAQLEFHHIGMATRNLALTSQQYEKIGYLNLKTCSDPIQGVKLGFLHKPGHPLIELVEPLTNSSPVTSIINKNGAHLYHVCYLCDDVDKTLLELKSIGFRAVSEVVPAIAFNNRRICFCYNPHTGLIELLETSGNRSNDFYLS